MGVAWCRIANDEHSVLPPPPRYPSQAAYNLAVQNGMAMPMVETNNLLKHPEGLQLLAGEGTYLLQDDLHLATPPHHPSETPVMNPNPLSTTPQAATAGTKLSLLSFSTKPYASPLYRLDTNKSSRTGLAQSSIQEHPYENRNSSEVPGSSDGGGTSVNGSARAATSIGSAPAFGEGNSLLSLTTKDTGKRRKPKSGILKSNSSFISRCIVNENLVKRLQDRPIDGYFGFANINRAFQWLDLSSPNKQDQLLKILFTKAHCLCHDVNQVTKSPNHIDIIMGFSTGEIIWFEPFTQKYSRLNKNCVINSTPVTQIRWIPGSENLFLASHMDGSLIAYDKEKDDAAFVPEEVGPNGNGSVPSEENLDPTSMPKAKLQIDKSVHSKNQKFNPVSFWKLSNQPINSFAFSPDNRHLAVVSENGTLRIIDYLKEQLLDIYNSYFGGLTCVCWSPDGKYVLSGGQDDLVSIWSMADSAIIARCTGHTSWVTDVAFDPWRCDDRNYRFGSVGEDGKLLLWDFSVGMLHRPKAASVRQRGSISSRMPSSLSRVETQGTTATAARFRSNSNLSYAEGRSETTVDHPVEPRAKISILPAVCTKIVADDPLCSLAFTEEHIITSDKIGHIRTWNRPKDHDDRADEDADVVPPSQTS
ncbi:putative catabolite repression protein crec protein [Botrytis fragariae]|uniref:Putative catabolite repression protein crec protein n=1 Tax=Botrytis fragariae TaxID=1964551 RepID=A0A8H6EE97_9HELO|nr:putative catabolite repression protein crec protein [Botrytis fragariae]KAF5869087.1 putative catabolite repression protein crec protein [Botrytis fragariae]